MKLDLAASGAGIDLMDAWLNRIRVVFVAVALVTLPTAAFAQVKVIVSGGFSVAYREALPRFERETGIKVITTSGPSVGNSVNSIGAQLRRGVPTDLIILSREGLEDLIAEGRIINGSDTDLAQTRLGLAVRVGAPKPDISTVEAFKQTLLRAKAVFATSTTGVYLTGVLLPQLGIATEMTGRIKTATGAVAKGDADLAIQPVSELLAVTDVDFVGPIPNEVQKLSVYAAAIVAGSKEISAAKKLIAFLASEGAAAAIRKNGMEPAGQNRAVGLSR